MRVAHVSCYHDLRRRKPAALLDAWPTLTDVAVAVARTGVQVTVFQAAHENASIKRDGVRFVFVADPGPTWLGRRLGPWGMPMPRRMAQELRALMPDVVHLNGLAYARHARFLGRAVPGAKVLVQDHANGPPRRIWRGVHRRGFARVHAVSFTAAEQARPFIECGVLRPDIHVFEIPEASSRFEPGSQEEARRRTGLHGDPCLLWLAHLDANKDPATVLRALAEAVRELPDARLWMCYRKATLLDDVRALIAGMPGLAGHVHLLGAQTHPRVQLLLQAADFLVQASQHEGSGYAVIEALACGTTPLVTDIASFRVLTGRGRHGSLTPPADPLAMAAAWVDWARRDRAQLRAEARAHFERELSNAAVGARLKAAYAELMQQ